MKDGINIYRVMVGDEVICEGGAQEIHEKIGVPRDHRCDGDCGKCRLTSLKWLQQEHVSTLLENKAKHLLCEMVKLYGDPGILHLSQVG